MKQYLIAGMVVLIGIIGWQYSIHEEDIEKISKLKMSISANKRTISEKQKELDGVNQLRKLDQEEILNHSYQINILEIENADANKKLEGFKKRKNIALRKPALVGKLANSATARVFSNLSCATGSRDKSC
jgi:hypothetical protein